MKQIYDLAGLSWSLSGWHPHYWEFNSAIETGALIGCDIGPVPAWVPGSVQEILRRAGLLPDWNVELNSRLCEWVEHRDWIFHTELPEEWLADSGQTVLCCAGLDYQGQVYLNGRCAGDFCGSFTPHSFDLTPFIRPGTNRLAIIFTGHPRYLGQIGYTSKIFQWKPRFNYIWDWVPRLVQTGISDSLTLETSTTATFDDVSWYTGFDCTAGTGSLVIDVEITLPPAAAPKDHPGVSTDAASTVGPSDKASSIRVTVKEKSRKVHESSHPAEIGILSLRIDGLSVEPWQPNGQGEKRSVYTLRVELLSTEGDVLDRVERATGFRSVEWRACRDAPDGAEPWICVVNGEPLFLQGVNWVPIRPNFADVTEADYRRRLELYRDLGMNILRVWGGAGLERECFYRLCDELGLMVWQEFPLSSSGIDNWPPEDEGVIGEIVVIAESYVRRRRHHPSLILWCGGNELQGSLDGKKEGSGKPVDATHPLITFLGETVRRLDPCRRFLPTSSSGPRFFAEAGNFGKGLHHDVHGPWNWTGSLEGWKRYWDGDDALFRSEAGMPGSSPAELIRRYGGEYAWPAKRENPFWNHTGGWWVQWPDYMAQGGDPEDLEAFVRWSQERQAEALVYAARACKKRFPACGGFILWMGHDGYPCPANTAIVDFHGNPKPAAPALREVFQEPAGT